MSSWTPDSETEEVWARIAAAEDILDWLTLIADDNERVEKKMGMVPRRNRMREAAQEIERLRALLHAARCSTDPYWAAHLLEAA